jgi:hypothetical protein
VGDTLAFNFGLILVGFVHEKFLFLDDKQGVGIVSQDPDSFSLQPNSPVSVICGKQTALATPMLALVAINVCSAAGMYGWLLRSHEDLIAFPNGG